MQYSCYGGTNAFLLEADLLKTPLRWSFWGCSKAAQGNTQQSSCCSTAHPWEGWWGAAGAAGMLPWHPQCSIPSLQPQQELCWWQEWLLLWPFHAQPGLLTVPLPKGQLQLLCSCCTSRLFQVSTAFFSCSSLEQRGAMNFAEWIADGSCCWKVTSVFSGQTVRKSDSL